MLWLWTLTSPLTLTLDFQGKILKLLCLRNGRVDSLGMKGMWVGYDVGCTIRLTLGHGAWQIDWPSNGSMWNSYIFQSFGPSMFSEHLVFSISIAVSLPCWVQNYRRILKLRKKLWRNDILQEILLYFNYRCILDRLARLLGAPGGCFSIKWDILLKGFVKYWRHEIELSHHLEVVWRLGNYCYWDTCQISEW